MHINIQHYSKITVRTSTQPIMLKLLLLLITVIKCFSISVNDLDASTELYLYSFPLVLSYITRNTMFYLPDNLMLPMPIFPNPNLTAIVKPNVDTLYDACWINHTKVEELVLTIPNTDDGVYYLFPLMDAWSNIVNSPGKTIALVFYYYYI